MDGAEHDPLSDDAALSTAVLARWPELAGATALLVNHSENHTYRFEGPDAALHMLRLHRPGYQTRLAIESELAWLGALAGSGIPVPRPIVGADGALVQEVVPDRFAVLFHHEPGGEPTIADDQTALFRTLGRFAATAHLHVGSWQRPEAFDRQRWDAAGLLDATSAWGDWRGAPHVEGEVLADLSALDARLRESLAAYGEGEDRFGLIHADMRLANLLVDGERTVLLDFDDSGFGWFLYDLAASLSFHETSPQVPTLIRSWLAGYLEVRPLTSADIGMIDTMILARRMALLAWIGSHAETPLAQSHAESFAVDTARLARRYLARG